MQGIGIESEERERGAPNFHAVPRRLARVKIVNLDMLDSTTPARQQPGAGPPELPRQIAGVVDRVHRAAARSHFS